MDVERCPSYTKCIQVLLGRAVTLASLSSVSRFELVFMCLRFWGWAVPFLNYSFCSINHKKKQQQVLQIKWQNPPLSVLQIFGYKINQFDDVTVLLSFGFREQSWFWVKVNTLLWLRKHRSLNRNAPFSTCNVLNTRVFIAMFKF